MVEEVLCDNLHRSIYIVLRCAIKQKIKRLKERIRVETLKESSDYAQKAIEPIQ